MPPTTPTSPSEEDAAATPLGLDATQVLASISDAFIAIDTEWRFAYINEQAEPLLGRTRDELLGKRVWDEFPEAVGSPFWDAYHRAVETQQAVSFEAFYEPLGLHVAVRAYPFAGGLSVYFTDVTEARRTSENLRQSERQFRQIAESLPQLVWTTTPEGYHDYFNDHWYAYTGMPRPDEPGGENDGVAQGFRWADYLHPDDLDRTGVAWGHSLATGDPYEVEYRFRGASDGAYRWFIARANALRGPDGEVVRWFGTCTDIHDQKKAEIGLRESEERFRGVSELTADFAYGVRIGPDGALTTEWTLGAYEDILGVVPEPGASATDWTDTIHPDDLPAALQRFEQLLRGEAIEGEYQICRPNGTCRWLRDRVRPTVDADGRIVGFVGAASDVTAEKDAERAVRESRARLEIALEGGRIGSWEWDIATDALTYDDRAAALWGADDVETAEDFLALVHPDDLPEVRAALTRTVEGGDPYVSEFRILRPGGRVRWLVGHGTVVSDGSRRKVYGLNYDVTERREQEEALRQKNAEMERFAYTVSHDLKSPLVTVTGFLGLLKTHVEAGRTDKALGAADRALGAAERMGRLIEDLLLLSRAGRTTGDPTVVDLDRLADRLAGDLRVRVKAAGGVVEVDHPLGRVFADEQRIDEALENLLANAVHYGLGGGGARVRLRSERARDGGLCVIVEDDGPGIPEAYRERVFDLFQRLETGGTGTGVGLAVVARVMEVHGGTAWVESAGGPPGHEGARFVLQFPSHAVAAEPEVS